LLVLCLCGSAYPESGGHPWLRRALVAASCAASVWDAQSTNEAVSRGAREGNGFLADASGRPLWGRIAAVKGGLCAGSVLGEIFWGRKHETLGMAVNGTLTGAFAAAAIHNLRVRNSIAAKPNAPPQ
jgi:hypothetical protein